ncbi:MAG: PCRF domain-containing protein, partial [Alphaproteobacteria bacterium]|nr:PCRF domain-containing protein [Alphaproteobacteria bacterium]
MIPQDRLHQIVERFEFLEASMAQGTGDIAALGREYSDLKPVVDQICAYQGLLSDLSEAEEMLSDPDMRALALEEIPVLKARLPEA